MKIEDSQGRPIAGARISPRAITFLGNAGFPDAWVPESFAESMTVTTDSDGRATIGYLNAGDRLLAVRLSADSIGTQDITIISADGGDPAARSMTIRLKPTSRIVGRVVNGRGNPIIDQQVEIWFRLETPHSTLAVAVGFNNGPPGTAADGSFRTADTLFVGSPYRVVVRGPGLEPVISDWTTITEAPDHLPPMVLRRCGRSRGESSISKASRSRASRFSNRVMAPNGRPSPPAPTVDSPWAASARARCSCSPGARDFGSTGSWSRPMRASSPSS